MTPARAEKLLEGQSATARKVFGAVPVLESWSVDDIRAELVRSGTIGAIERHVALRCLRDLVDAGLIGEPQREWFRSRVKVVPAMGIPLFEPVDSVQATSEPVMQTPTAAPAAKPSTMDTLANLADNLGEAVNAMRKVIVSVQTVAKQIEEVALTIETEQQASTEQLKKLGQLQSILRDLTPAS